MNTVPLNYVFLEAIRSRCFRMVRLAKPGACLGPATRHNTSFFLASLNDCARYDGRLDFANVAPMYTRLLLVAACAVAAFPAGFQSSDILKLRSVGTVQFSPDGSRIAYTIIRNDGPRRPVAQLWIMTVADRKSICLSAADEPSGDPEWSPDGKWIAYSGRLGTQSGMLVARPDGSGKKYLGPLDGTNAPLPTTGKNIAWSPDSRRIAYVSSQPEIGRAHV